MKRTFYSSAPAWPKLLAAGIALLELCPLQAQAAVPTSQIVDDPDPRIAENLPEIIVTARKRPEVLQRTPVSIIALSASDLDARSMTNLRSLQNFVPNLTFAPAQNVGEAAANIFIRGIGQEDFGIGAEAGVGFYVDGVYIARSLGTVANLFDVDRIEVLRGPQGTLFGKDTIGGAINVISIAPQPGRERRVDAILGTDARTELRSVVNEPLSSQLFARLSIGIVSRDGYLRRLQPPVGRGSLEQVNRSPINLASEGNDRSQAGRLQLRWLVTDALTADFSFDASRKRNTQGAVHIDLIDPTAGSFPDINTLIAEGKLPGPLITAELAPGNLLQSYAANGNRTDQDIWGASIVVTRDSGDSSLKFIGAYRGLRSHVATDDDGLYYQLEGNDLRVRQSQFSGELQYNGVAGRLAYTAGLYAFTEMPRLLPTRPQPDIFYTCGCISPDFLDPLESETRRIRTLSYAGYAQGSVRLSDRLSATVGARLTRESKTLDGATYAVDTDLRPTGPTLREGHAKDSWNSFTFRAGVEYQATADLMAFGSVARGFKSGGFNVRGQANLPNMGFAPFDPETALTFEIGLRSEWLRRRLRVNATLFDTEYKNIQLRQLTEVGEIFTTLIENAARARITGAEFELAAVPFDGLTVTAAYGHLNPRYLDVGNVLDLTLHSRFQRTPRNSFTTSLNYAAALPVGTLEGQIDYSFRSKEQFQILAAINDQAAYALIGARVTFRAPRDRWNVALFSTNLTDRRYRTAGRGTLVEHAGFAYSSIGLPRQVGIELSTAF